MDQVHVIRHKVLVERRSARQVAKEFGISRRTVRKYLTEAVPMRRETQPVWETVRARVEQLLTESVQWTGGKQRLTATRLHELLLAEGKRGRHGRQRGGGGVETAAAGGLCAVDVSTRRSRGSRFL